MEKGRTTKWRKEKKSLNRADYSEWYPPNCYEPMSDKEHLMMRIDPEMKKSGKSRKKLTEIAKAKKIDKRIVAMEQAQDTIFEKLPGIIEKACEMAGKGDVTAIKLILDRSLPTYKQREEKGSGNKGVTINITSATDLKLNEAIDGEIVNPPSTTEEKENG